MKRYAVLNERVAEMSEEEAKDFLVKVFSRIYDINIYGEEEAYNQIKELYKRIFKEDQ